MTADLTRLQIQLEALGILPSGFVGRRTFATLPAVRVGAWGFCTDIGDGVWVCANNAGTRWIPMGGQAQVAWLAADSVHAAASAQTIDLQARFPAGALAFGDQIEAWGQAVKSGNTDTMRTSMLVGSAGTTADTSIITDQQPLAATGLAGAILYAITLSNPSGTPKGQRIGAGNQTAGFLTLNNTSAQTAAINLAANPTTNATYVSLATKGGATVDSCTVQAGARLIWRTPVA